VLHVEIGGICSAARWVSDDLGTWVCSNFPAVVESALQELDPSVRVNRDTGNVDFSAGVSIQGYERGHELIDRLVGSGHTIVISRFGSSEGGQMNPSNWDRSYQPLQGSSSEVRWNPDNTDHRIPVISGGTEVIPTYLILGHELVHADQARLGVLSPQDRRDSLIERSCEWAVLAPPPGSPSNAQLDNINTQMQRRCGYAFRREVNGQQTWFYHLRRSETSSWQDIRIISENDLRQERGLPMRSSP
jgi:hypothetical protein